MNIDLCISYYACIMLHENYADIIGWWLITGHDVINNVTIASLHSYTCKLQSVHVFS